MIWIPVKKNHQYTGESITGDNPENRICKREVTNQEPRERIGKEEWYSVLF